MTLRKRSAKPPSSRKLTPPPAVEVTTPAEAMAQDEIMARRFVDASLALGVARYEIVAVLVGLNRKGGEFGLPMKQATELISKVKSDQQVRYSEILKSSRQDQVIRLRALLRDYRLQLEDTKAARYPKHGDIVRLEALIAAVEGNLAPTRKIVAFGELTQEKLELLGVQTTEEIAEYIALGRAGDE
jgi:hypothetical protein